MDENRSEGAARQFGGKVENAAGNLTGDAKTSAEGVLDQAAGAAQRSYGQAKDAVTDAAGQAADAAQRAYGQARDAVSNVAGQARDMAGQAGDYGSQVLDGIEEAGDYLAEQVDQRPITAVLVAAGVGFLLALLTKPSYSSRHRYR